MIANFFRLPFRQLKKTKDFTLLNILGLTLGLMTVLFIVLYVTDEWSYDHFNTRAAQIYRVNTDLKINSRITYLADAAPPVAPTLVREYPEIEKATRLLPVQGGLRIKKGDKELQETRVVLCDPEIFDIFTLPMIEGNPATALQAPNSVVITESTAIRYFNSTKVVGRRLTDIDDTTILTVTGVIRELPVQSSFHYDLFLSMRGNSMETNSSYYELFPMSTFVLLRPDADPVLLQKKLASFMDTWDKDYSHFDDSSYYLRLNLIPLTDIHLWSNRTDELSANGNIQYVYIFSAIAAFVLLIAAINFMNLSTARSANRAREVGVQKVLGCSRRRLIAQFLAESLMVTLVSIVLALGLSVLVMPWFNQLADKHLSIDARTLAWMLPFMGIALFTVGILSGAYPAFFLSAVRPIEVLKGKLSAGFKGGALRSMLVVFQFSVSLFLITGTVIIYRQLHYIQSKDLGFDRNRVLIIKGMNSISDPSMLKREVQRLPGIADASLSGYLPTNDKRWHNYGSLAGNPQGLWTQLWKIDADYLPALDMHPVLGRNFSSTFPTDSSAIILNETAARLFGIAGDPLNKKISFSWNGHNRVFHIICVVKDFNFASLRDNVTPLAMVMDLDEDANLLIIRTTTNNLAALLPRLKTKWTALAPYRAFEYSFMDTEFDALYRSEQRVGQLSVLFSGLAIAIACLGLLGLGAFAAEQRTKEIGIRKVLGAKVTSIVVLLSTDFIRLIAIAILIASPLAWIGMVKWLQNFAYRTTVNGWLFVFAGGIVLLIALATTIFQFISAAVANPVKTLRSE